MNRVLAAALRRCRGGRRRISRRWPATTRTRSSVPTRTPEVVPRRPATLSCPESPRTKQTETSLLAVTPLAPDDEASTS